MLYDCHMAKEKRIRRKDAARAEKSSGSKTLAELARRLGIKVENPIAFDPQSGRFYTAEDYARDKNLVDESHLFWLLDFAQRGDDSFTPNDELMLNTFAGLDTSALPRIRPKRFANLQLKRSLTFGVLSLSASPGNFRFPTFGARCDGRAHMRPLALLSRIGKMLFAYAHMNFSRNVLNTSADASERNVGGYF